MYRYLMITIFSILKKKKKSVKDYTKLIIFGFFVLMIMSHIGEIKPLDYDE